MGRAPCCDKANVKKGPWSPEEDAKLKTYIEQYGTGGNWIALPQKIGIHASLSLSFLLFLSFSSVFLPVWNFAHSKSYLYAFLVEINLIHRT